MITHRSYISSNRVTRNQCSGEAQPSGMKPAAHVAVMTDAGSCGIWATGRSRVRRLQSRRQHHRPSDLIPSRALIHGGHLIRGPSDSGDRNTRAASSTSRSHRGCFPISGTVSSGNHTFQAACMALRWIMIQGGQQMLFSLGFLPHILTSTLSIVDS